MRRTGLLVPTYIPAVIESDILHSNSNFPDNCLVVSDFLRIFATDIEQSALPLK